MRIYPIAPVAHLDLMILGTDSIFGLAHLYVQHEHYRQFLKDQKAAGKWITMDNSAAEKELVTEDILIQVVKDLLPNEVISPDILFNHQQTIENLDSFISRMSRENLLDKVEIFAVPQGNTKEEWINCYLDMLTFPLVKTLGISKLGVPHAFLGQAKDDQGIMESRHMAIKYLLENNLIQKPLHFLGMGSPEEYKWYKELNNPLLRSTDSCYSILSAINELNWSQGQFDRIPTPKDYFDCTMTNEEINLAKDNIQWFKNLIS